MPKYHNQKYRGHDSKKEAARHQELILLQRAGVISDLQCQVPFVLIPAQYVNGKCVERACKYVADYTYFQNGKYVVEDVKGYRDGAAYRIFTIKRKLMLYVHNIRVKEV